VGVCDVQPDVRQDEYPAGSWVNISQVGDIDAERLRDSLKNVRKAHLFVRWTRQDSTRIQALMSTRHKACQRLMVNQGEIMETVLLLEGLNDGCGCSSATYNPLKGIRKRGIKKMAGIKRITIPGRGVRCHDGHGKFVKCPTGMGYTRSRSRGKRRSLLGGLGQMTDAKGLLAQFQPQLVAGGIAAAGAWVTQSIGDRIGKAIMQEKYVASSTTSLLAKLAGGVFLASMLGKLTKKPEFGVSFGAGVIAVTILNLIGTIAPVKTAGFGVLQAEAAPYYQRSMAPPLYQMQALPAGASSVPNLYSDVGVASIV